MASLGFTFDHTQVDTNDTFEPIPAGEYVVEVIDSDVRQTKSGSGEYISLTLRVIDGEYENRRIFTNINHRNANEKAQMMGEKQVTQICRAVGLRHGLEDTVELHNIPIKAVVVVEEGSNGYGPRNSVRAYKPVEGVPHVAPAAQAPASSGKPAAPWKR